MNPEKKQLWTITYTLLPEPVRYNQASTQAVIDQYMDSLLEESGYKDAKEVIARIKAKL